MPVGRSPQPFSHPDWLFEIKWDGFRAVLCSDESGVRLVSRKTIEWMTSDHLGATPAYNDLLIPGYGFGLGFAVRTQAGMAPQPGSVGQYFWSGIGGTSFFVDPVEDIFAILMTQAPNQRIFFRNMFRHLVYAAVD